MAWSDMHEKQNDSKVFYEEGLRFKCQMSGKCCTSRDAYGFVYLNENDRLRMAQELELSEPEFRATFCTQTDGFWHINDPERDCLFLQNKQCSVYRARPSQCSTWPFWRENLRDEGAWFKEVAGICPGAGKGPVIPKRRILQVLEEEKEADRAPQ